MLQDYIARTNKIMKMIDLNDIFATACYQPLKPRNDLISNRLCYDK